MKLQIAAVLEGLYEKLVQTLKAELDIYRIAADKFYESSESRDSAKSQQFYTDYLKKRDTAVLQAGKEYLQLQGAEAPKAYQRALDFFEPKQPVSARDFYAYVSWGYIAPANLTKEEKECLDDGKRQAIMQLCDQWIEVRKKAMNKHWKPIRVLSGEYGEYNKCICYDEEFGVFFQLCPDDNYYHWESYELYTISKTEAENALEKTLGNLSEATVRFPENYFDKKYRRIEIIGRIEK